MIIRYYADVMPDTFVRCVFTMQDPDEGPPRLPNCEGTPYALPDDFVYAPPSDTSRPVVVSVGFGWVETASWAQLQADKVAAMRATCQATILAGFVSTALDEGHTYPANPTDQINLLGSITDSLLPDLAPDWTTAFWCMDSAGAWAMRAHTAAQIQQVGRDAKAAILAAITTNEALRVAIMAATEPAQLDDIRWPE